MRAATPSIERCTKRSVSRVSCPNAFTTRRAPSVSCTTASAELSSFLTCRDWRRIRGRYRRDSRNSGGGNPRGTSASRPSRGGITTVIDRERGVEGERGDLGGRRIIKKKKKGKEYAQ